MRVKSYGTSLTPPRPTIDLVLCSEIDQWSGKRKRELISKLAETNEGLKGFSHVNKKVGRLA